MKVKEEYSNEFKKNEEEPIVFGEKKQIIVKEKGDLILFEQKTERDYLSYSTYRIYDKKYNESYFSIFVPDPEEKDLYKTLYLKYQKEAKNFLLELLDVLAGEKEDIEPFYKTEFPSEFIYKKDGRSVLINPVTDSHIFAIINFGQDIDLSLNVAYNFVKFFEGKKATFKKVFDYRKEDGKK